MAHDKTSAFVDKCRPNDTSGKLVTRLWVPGRLPSLNELVGAHWSRYHRLVKAWREAVDMEMLTVDRGAPVAEKGERRRLVIEPVYAGKLPDHDNVYVKPLVDALKARRRYRAGRGMTIWVDGPGVIYDDDKRHLVLEVREPVHSDEDCACVEVWTCP